MAHVKGPNLYRNRCRKLSAENAMLRRIMVEARRLIGFMTNEKIAEASRLLLSGIETKPGSGGKGIQR